MNDGLHLYVWKDVFRDYTPGIAFALAHNEDEARMLILASMDYGDAEAYWAWRNDPEKLWEYPYAELREAPEVHDEPFGIKIYGGG